MQALRKFWSQKEEVQSFMKCKIRMCFSVWANVLQHILILSREDIVFLTHLFNLQIQYNNYILDNMSLVYEDAFHKSEEGNRRHRGACLSASGGGEPDVLPLRRAPSFLTLRWQRLGKHTAWNSSAKAGSPGQIPLQLYHYYY